MTRSTVRAPHGLPGPAVAVVAGLRRHEHRVGTSAIGDVTFAGISGAHAARQVRDAALVQS